ncbi:MAG: MgtC/SapB family protein [Marvinbryantia sp.]|uniref:MgtC/SapB family protein n=1 Tax=Marvinbryantia sp. TaxID=2496532 RepID=UPI0025FA9CF7|nr:MgtC/SapB family protein [uncultured Marvinbryantia sp.]
MVFLLKLNFTEFESGALLKIILAFACGASIGLEREKKGCPAGLKTFSFVCLGSTLVMITNDFICQFLTHGTGDPARMAAQVVSGIGFLGAGSIMVTGYNQVRGLTTAAALWVTAALGLSIGTGFYFGAFAGLCVIHITAFVFNYVDRKIMERSRSMTIYVDGENEEFMLRLMEYFNFRGIRVVNLMRKAENKWYVNDVCAMIAIRFPKKDCHRTVLAEIRQIEGLRFVEEL